MFILKQATAEHDQYSSTQVYKKLEDGIQHAIFLCDKYHGGMSDLQGTSTEEDIKKQGFSLVYGNNEIMSVMIIEKVEVN